MGLIGFATELAVCNPHPLALFLGHPWGTPATVSGFADFLRPVIAILPCGHVTEKQAILKREAVNVVFAERVAIHPKVMLDKASHP